jgi:nitrogen fixation protein FixH
MTMHADAQTTVQSASPGSGKGTLKGWHVLLMILAFFGVTITVNVIFITYAMSSFPGEDVPKSYTQGIHYNDVLDARAAQARLGWTAALALDESAATPRILVSLNASGEEPIAGAILEGRMRRPATTAYDTAITFVPAGQGLYAADLPQVGPGRWQVEFTARRGEDSFTAEREIIVK